jgi:phenylalanyl-tRNA synthetase beta chain
MKFSEQWLREWVNPDVDSQQLMDQLTMAGLEVDGSEPVASGFAGVVVGEIIEAEAHPEADKLSVCQVAGHPDGDMQVVCGAPNARVGIKVPFALIGANLPGKDKEGNPVVLEIKQASLRGVESSGMLCGAEELGMESEQDGLLELPAELEVGTDLRQAMNLDDSSIEVDLTPNRGDCFSIRGIARDIGVVNRQLVTEPDIPSVTPASDKTFSVKIENTERCPRYAGRVISGVDVTRPSPLWLQEKLRRSGIRSIDAVVDITNYVMLELGQPMHAFDLDKLDGGIVVREASGKEKIALLNDEEVEPATGTLLIADASSPLALAGIMGGKDSAVSENTKNLFLEAAHFEPVAMAGKARELGLHTDSSLRFERGVDPELPSIAIERATALLMEITGGEPGPLELQDHLESRNREVTLTRSRLDSYLGVELEETEVSEMLQLLGMSCSFSGEQWVVSVPSWRFDVAIEVDLVEEIARIYGYNRLPVTSVTADIELAEKPETSLPRDQISLCLCDLGYQEAITYSFVDPDSQQALGLSDGQIEVMNPISTDMGVMRTSLLPGLLHAAKYNLNRQQDKVSFFELGLVFSSLNDEMSQKPVLGMLATGPRWPENWAGSSQPVDFYDIKSDLEAVMSLSCSPDQLLFEAGDVNGLHPGQTALINLDGSQIGFMGALHPQQQGNLGFDHPVIYVQMDVGAITTTQVPVFEPLSKFPEIRRDIAVLIDKDLPVSAVRDKVLMAAGGYLQELKVFDVYSGEGIDPQRKSVGLGLTFQAKSRTLTDSEITDLVGGVVEALEQQFQAELRN